MDSMSLTPTLPAERGVREDVPSRRHRAWNTTTAFGAAAAAVLALAVAAFPGEWTALWRNPGVASAPLLDSGLPTQRDRSGELYADLERHLRWQPSDARALVFKARLDMRAQRYEQAASAYEAAVAGKAAGDPGVWVEYAEARGMAQGRTLVGEPLKLVHKALAIDAGHAQALDLAGSAAWEMRDFAQAAVYWEQLLQQLPPGTARHTELSRAIERAQQRSKLSLPASQAALPAN